jgi:hypothetical protein
MSSNQITENIPERTARSNKVVLEDVKHEIRNKKPGDLESVRHRVSGGTTRPHVLEAVAEWIAWNALG